LVAVAKRKIPVPAGIEARSIKYSIFTLLEVSGKAFVDED
jgi:hypothetical protein